MAQKTYEIPDAQYKRIVDGFCYQNGYTDTVSGPLLETIPNPVTKDDFFDQAIYGFIKNSVEAYETTKAIQAVSKSTKADVDMNIKLSPTIK